MELFLLGFTMGNTFFTLFMSCELSQRLSNSFLDINDLMNQFQWYRFPTKVKRILPMALMFVQQPVELEGFGSIVCCRETFGKVTVKIDLGYAYYFP